MPSVHHMNKKYSSEQVVLSFIYAFTKNSPGETMSVCYVKIGYLRFCCDSANHKPSDFNMARNPPTRPTIKLSVTNPNCIYHKSNIYFSYNSALSLHNPVVAKKK